MDKMFKRIKRKIFPIIGYKYKFVESDINNEDLENMQCYVLTLGNIKIIYNSCNGRFSAKFDNYFTYLNKEYEIIDYIKLAFNLMKSEERSKKIKNKIEKKLRLS